MGRIVSEIKSSEINSIDINSIDINSIDINSTGYYVAYFVIQQQKAGYKVDQDTGNVQSLHPMAEENAVIETQRKTITNFLESRGTAFEIIESFSEAPENKRTSKWPQLEKAVKVCQQRKATLIIAELGLLTNNETFTQILLESGINFYCCDQPFVNQIILEALYKHAQVQRKLHGKLIKEGLMNSTNRSGNPNAAEVIREVNEPKIYAAIVFAFLLQPIIADYRCKGFSQRQMVKTLNEEGFTAPEGGKWVLSQLQKVLDRVRLNEIATEVASIIQDLNKSSEAEIAEELNRRNIASIKRSAWDEVQTKKLLTRLDQIKDIKAINKFVINILPLIHTFRSKQLSTSDMLQQIDKAGITIPNEMNSLAEALKSVSKQLPVYLKIIKTHITQLDTVLKTNEHGNRSLETAELAEPAQQLIKLFRNLNEDDLQVLESLSSAANTWQDKHVAVETTDSEAKTAESEV